MAQVEVRAESVATPQRLWDFFTKVEAWDDWAPFDEVTVQEGQGVGETRLVKSGLVTAIERVVALDPGRRYVYELLSGLPVRDYVAEVLFQPVNGQRTQIRWTAHFDAKIPGTGWVLALLLEAKFRQSLAALVRTAET